MDDTFNSTLQDSFYAPKMHIANLSELDHQPPAHVPPIVADEKRRRRRALHETDKECSGQWSQRPPPRYTASACAGDLPTQNHHEVPDSIEVHSHRPTPSQAYPQQVHVQDRYSTDSDSEEAWLDGLQLLQDPRPWHVQYADIRPLRIVRPKRQRARGSDLSLRNQAYYFGTPATPRIHQDLCSITNTYHGQPMAERHLPLLNQTPSHSSHVDPRGTSNIRRSTEDHLPSNPRSTNRRPTVRLSVQGLSYITEDTERMLRVPNRQIPHQPDNGGGHHQPPPPGPINHIGQPRPARPRMVSQQPQRHPGMVKTRGNRNAKGMPYSADGKRDWSTDLCLFCDHNLGTCCKALWCPCIVYGKNKARIEHLYEEEKAHPERGGTCSGDCVVHGCLTAFCLFGWAIQIPNRAMVRRRYGIEGDWLGDCAAALFCSPCELSQESREIDLEERSFRNRRKQGHLSG